MLDLLTEADAIARWAPIPFHILALDGRRLLTGSRARVAGSLAGRSIEFELVVLEASDERLSVRAHGPISIAAEYFMRQADAGSEVRADVTVEGRGIVGRILARSTETLLAAGALRTSLDRLGRELRPAPTG